MAHPVPEKRRRQYILAIVNGPVVITLFIGILFAVVALLMWRDWEMQKIRFAFQRSADRHISALNKQIDAIEYLVESVKSLYLSSDTVEDHEFRDFVTPHLQRNPAVSPMEWIARRPIGYHQHEDADQPDKEDGNGYNEALESFQVAFVVPAAGNQYRLGADPFLRDPMRKAMQKGRDADTITTSQGFSLEHGKIDPLSFQLFQPIYINGATIESKMDRRRHLNGFIAARVQVPELLESAWRDLDCENMSILVFVESDTGADRFLYAYPPDRNATYKTHPSMAQAIAGSAVHQTAIVGKADQKWRVLTVATSDYIAVRREGQVYGVPLILLVCTAIVALFVNSSSNKKKQLADTNKKLMMEIQERLIAQTALEEERDLSNTLIQSSPLFFVAADENGTVQIVNRALLDATGYTAKEILGKAYLQTLVREEDIAIIRGAARRLFHDRTDIVIETTLKCKDEGAAPVLAEWHLTPVSQLRGKASFFLGLGIDISEKRRKEEALRQSEERYTKLIESSPDGIFVCTLDGLFLDANRAFETMIGYNKKSLKKMSCFDLANAPSRDLWRALPEKIVQGTISGPVELELADSRKNILSVSLNGWAIGDSSGRHDRLGFVVRDISAQKDAEKEREELLEKLRQSQKMESIGTLAGGIAHDFNNILSIIIGFGELATMTDTDKGANIQQCLDEILTAAGRAKDLVAQILTFSRQSDEKRKPMQPNHIVKEAIKFLRASIPSTIEIRTRIDEQTGIISANPTQLHQIIMNLCSNASHAMKETGGVILIEVTNIHLDAEAASKDPNLVPGPYVKLSVKDSGQGISQENLDRIFDPYFTTKEQGEGTGLGLSVVHGIVKAHEGAILVSSHEGKGTTFELFFPIVSQVFSQESAPDESDTPGGDEHVLFVDDEAQLVGIGKHLLERGGYQVTGKLSGIEALETFRATPDKFDLVITDMTMPKMTGIEMAQQMKAIRPDIPIILCTGLNNGLTPAKLAAAGVDHLVEKPVLPRKLYLTIRQVLDDSVEGSGNAPATSSGKASFKRTSPPMP